MSFSFDAVDNGYGWSGDSAPAEPATFLPMRELRLKEAHRFIDALPSSINGWIDSLPSELLNQTRRIHGQAKAVRLLEEAYSKLILRGFTCEDVHLAILNDAGLLAFAAALSSTARAADGYARNEPPGRPEHDRRWQMIRLRAKRADVIINLESALEIMGPQKWKAKYSGEASRLIKKGSNERTAEYLDRGKIIIPTFDKTGRKTGEKVISLREGGSTRHKSFSSFVGFLYALQNLATGRQWTMVTINPPAHRHPSSPCYDGVSTQRDANRELSRMKKKALDTLRKWHVEAAGASMKEPHQSSIPHCHLAMAHTAREIAELRLDAILDTEYELPNGDKYKLTIDDLGTESRIWVAPPKDKRPANWTVEDPRNWRVIKKSSRDQTIEEMAQTIIEDAFERHCLDLARDDGTGRLVKGVGVDFKHFDKNGAAQAISYVMTYLLKSFAIDIDKLPKRDKYCTDEAFDKAKKEYIQEQVENGGDLSVAAWASATGTRTRELFGMPSRSPWTALGKQHEPCKDAELERIRLMILDKKNPGHTEYTKLMGGLNASRNDAILRMRREKLPSNYPLRPDMIRTRVVGVWRMGLSMWDRLADRDMATREHPLRPTAFQRTRIDGCQMFIGMTKKEEDRKARRSQRSTPVHMDNSMPGVPELDSVMAEDTQKQDNQRYKCWRRDTIGALIPNSPSLALLANGYPSSDPPNRLKLLQ